MIDSRDLYRVHATLIVNAQCDWTEYIFAKHESK